jgi:cyclopropane fatty-acyl-phospholipid synthase-like methyltransferase
MALDVGCGAGLSTEALAGVADRRLGIEPSESMLRWAQSTAPGADFLVATAEEIPLAPESVDFISAAGSLNYVDLARFFPEADRILTADGVMVVYDFFAGRSFRDSPRLDEWYSDFIKQYPKPVSEARPLSPEILAAMDSGFTVRFSETVEIDIPISQGFFLEYMMTETNVAAALRAGAQEAAVRRWCDETLAEVFENRNREVLFRGYFACLSRRN